MKGFSGLFATLFLILSGYRSQMVHSESQTCQPGQGEVLVRSESKGLGVSASHRGTFHSPTWTDGHVTERRCVYRFVADVGEKVYIKFEQFNLNGQMPSCTEDFLDIYIDVASSSLDIDREQARLNHLASGEPITTTPFSAAVYSDVLDRSTILGRYCSDSLNAPRSEFVSLHREVVLDFFVNSAQVGPQGFEPVSGFRGTYEFINDSNYYRGSAVKPLELGLDQIEPITSSCLFRIDQSNSNAHSSTSHGELISPTYPGWHPDDLFCAYQLIGRANQRINVDVLELDTFGSMDSCLTDYLLFYDGPIRRHDTPVINSRFCGSQRRIRIVSSTSNLLIIFATGVRPRNQNPANATRHGFLLRYSFSEILIPVSSMHRALHIRGTECDYMITGQIDKESEGMFESPNFQSNQELAPNRVCSVYFIGSVSKHQLQAVHIRFEQVNLPGGNEDCHQGFLTAYGARSMDHPYQLAKKSELIVENHIHLQPISDQLWCSNEDGQHLQSLTSTATPLSSQHSVLVLQLNASAVSKGGFKATFRLQYRFVNDFGIPGYQPEAKRCQFIYSPSTRVFTKSTQTQEFIHSSGWTNSPFYPNSYPPDVICDYVFFGADSVRLQFDTFETQAKLAMTSDAVLTTALKDGLMACSEDYLEVIFLQAITTFSLIQHLLAIITTRQSRPTNHVLWQNRWQSIEDQFKRELGGRHDMIRVHPALLYCGNYTPGPIDTGQKDTAILLRFVSARDVAGRGFNLHYEFPNDDVMRKASNTEVMKKAACTRNTTLSAYGGLLRSPAYPDPYPDGAHCTWILNGPSKISRFLLQLDRLDLDGSYQDCSRAVLRIWSGSLGKFVSEFCGKRTESESIILSGKAIRIEFLSTQNFNGATGFKLIWTALLSREENEKCTGFQCEHSRHCISRDLLCDGLLNCGHWKRDGNVYQDESDETFHCSKSVTYNLWHIGTGVFITLILLFILILLIYYRERARRKMMPVDPLAELSGSKHSLVSSQYGSKSHKSNSSKTNEARSNCSKRIPIKSNENHSHHVIYDSLNRKQTRSQHSSLVKTHKHHNQHHHHHQYTMKATNSLRPNVKDVHRKLTRNHSVRSTTLTRNESRSYIDPLINNPLGADMDGGLLIRERMQKISIV